MTILGITLDQYVLIGLLALIAALTLVIICETHLIIQQRRRLRQLRENEVSEE